MRGNKCAQLYTDRDRSVHVLLMRSKARSSDSLGNLVKDTSIMNEIHCGNVLEQVGTNAELIRKACNGKIHVSTTNPYSPWQKNSKNQIQIIKCRAHMCAARHKVPERLLNSGLVWEA